LREAADAASHRISAWDGQARNDRAALVRTHAEISSFIPRPLVVDDAALCALRVGARLSSTNNTRTR
jgi:hypothetical protein